MTVENVSRPRFTHGGARVGAGRKRGVRNRWPAALAAEIRRLVDEVEKLRVQRRIEGEHGERILARLVAIDASSGWSRGSRCLRRLGTGHWGGDQ